MTVPTPRLSDAAIQTRLESAPAWDLQEHKLHRLLRFPDFATAFAFMTRVADLAEAADHHPEWHNTYNQVEIWLSTHEAGGITTKDFALAEAIDRCC